MPNPSTPQQSCDDTPKIPTKQTTPIEELSPGDEFMLLNVKHVYKYIGIDATRGEARHRIAIVIPDFPNIDIHTKDREVIKLT